MNNGYNPQQQPPVQPKYPPQYTPQYHKQPSLIDRIYGQRTDTLQTLLMVASMIMLILAPVYFLYRFIDGIVRASEWTGTFGVFISYFASGALSAAQLITYGLLLAGLKRLISK
ncbi:MAG: hypothetical protein CVU97_03245 [Firmicutes bacterium HGW-Firmicutes-21]|nr:MAG: hypothetical protein CVU97_03245 [Firmicutes bacterium HGW-Firmicutes-21]